MIPSVDPALGIVYFGTSNASPQYGGEVRPGDNLYTTTALALDLKPGKQKWHFQVLHHDIWEGDLGTPLVLREEEYWTLLSGATGQLYGSNFTDKISNGWTTANVDSIGLVVRKCIQCSAGKS